MKPGHAARVPQYLQHILDAIDRAIHYVAGMDLAAFEADTRTQGRGNSQYRDRR
jgi:uncharacterized protein with HEPN domain